MNRIRQNAGVFGLFMVLVLLISCETALTTSWGTIFKRDPKKVKVTASNVEDLLKNARGDDELSRAILDAARDKVKDPGTSAKDKATLQAAAVTAAKQAAALDTLIMDNIDTIVDAGSDTDLEGLLDSILGGAEKHHITEIADELEEIFHDDITETGKPEFKEDSPLQEEKVLSDADLVNLIITIMLGKAAEYDGALQSYLDLWGTTKFIETGVGLDPDERLAAAAYDLLKKRGSENALYDAIRDIVEVSGEEL